MPAEGTDRNARRQELATKVYLNSRAARFSNVPTTNCEARLFASLSERAGRECCKVHRRCVTDSTAKQTVIAYYYHTFPLNLFCSCLRSSHRAGYVCKVCLADSSRPSPGSAKRLRKVAFVTEWFGVPRRALLYRRSPSHHGRRLSALPALWRSSLLIPTARPDRALRANLHWSVT